jgi:uncharacterized protein
MTDAELIDAVAGEVKRRMAGQEAGHGIDHVTRVVNLARLLQEREGGDARVIALAAWLHDVGDAKFCNGVERGAELSREILHMFQASPATIAEVVEIVDRVSFRKGYAAEHLSWEGKIVQDADRLEALGAIGIVRTIEYGSHRGRPFYTTGEDMTTSQCGLAHFYQKLFKLPELLHTPTARQMAERRVAFMQQFVTQFMQEWQVAHDTA